MSDNIKKPNWAINAEKIMAIKDIHKNQLMDVFGVKTVGAVVHYFNGRREPSLVGIQRLAQYLDVTINNLLGIEDEGNSDLDKINGKLLTDALQILIRTVEITNSDIEIFFNVYKKIGAENILKAANMLSEVSKDESNIPTLIKIQDFAKKTINI